MKEFLSHKKTKALILGLGMILIAFGGLKLGLLPADDRETAENETMQALMMLIGSAGGLVALFIGAQGYADGKSGGATATTAHILSGAKQGQRAITRTGPAILLICMLGLGAGCAAPDGVLEAHQDMGKIFVSLANQHAGLIDLLAIPASEKAALLDEARIDIDGFERVHSAMGAYFDSTDVFDQKQATEWISIIKKTRAALTGGEGDDG